MLSKDLSTGAERGEVTLSMNAANLIEVYYDRVRKLGSGKADDTIRNICEDSPISIIEELNPAIVREAAYFFSKEVVRKLKFPNNSILRLREKCLLPTPCSWRPPVAPAQRW